jgi:hypothetical protein
MSKTYKFEPMTLERCCKEYKPEAAQQDVDEVNRLMEINWPKLVARLKEIDRRKALPQGSFEALQEYDQSKRYSK